MKTFIVLLLIGMCGCLTEAQAPAAATIEEPEVESEPDSGSDSEPEPTYDMCFSVTDEARDVFPEIGECLEQVGLAWGIEIVTDDDCKSSVGMHTFRNTDLYAEGERYEEETVANILMTDRSIDINLSALWAANGRMVDKSPEDCEASGADITLRNALLHEIGHALLLDHDHELGFMTQNATCEFLNPSESMLLMAQNPYWKSL